MKEKNKFRHELKHIVNYSDYLALRNRLKAVTVLDNNVKEDGTYKIRSLYFDNLHDKVLREKIDGVNQREKFRIRYYNEDYDFIRLEKKSKLYGLCLKESVLITKKQCERLIKGDIDWMREEKKALFIELYTKMKYQQLKPKVIVDYIREPYIYRTGNVRVTLDYKIRTGLVCIDLFQKDLVSLSVPEDKIILEVKYDEFLPDIITNLIQLRDRRTEAYSKYTACRMYG